MRGFAIYNLSGDIDTGQLLLQHENSGTSDETQRSNSIPGQKVYHARLQFYFVCRFWTVTSTMQGKKPGAKRLTFLDTTPIC